MANKSDIPKLVPPEIFDSRSDDSREVAILRNLVRHDDRRECPMCSKDTWGSLEHDKDCPFGQAYKFLIEME